MIAWIPNNFLYASLFVLWFHFYIVCCRRAGYVYQYYEAIEQDVEGVLEIVSTQIDTTETTGVDNGLCQDFFELRMVREHKHVLYICTILSSMPCYDCDIFVNCL